MSDQGATKKRPLEEETQDVTSSSSHGNGGTAEATTTTTGGQDGPSAKKLRPEESSSASASRPTGGSAASGASHPVPQHPDQQQQQQQRRGPSRPALFFGVNIPDDVVQTIAEFLYEHCHHPNVEIEAKIGILMDRNTGKRIEMPVKNEVVLMPQARAGWYTFSSDMTVVVYKHTYEKDQFYNIQGHKTRVTRDQKTNEILGTVRKDRIADLDIFSPRRPFDYRVSVNVEVPVPYPGDDAQPQRERQKDRVSYRLNNLKIDLTQVKSNNTPGNTPNSNRNQPPSYSQMRPPAYQQQQQSPDLTHELEIEFVHPEELVHERDVRIKSGGRQPDRFLEMTANFINNIRGLIAQGYNIPPPHHQQQYPH
ncbi:mRNA-capping enzyme subunit beta [Mortierella sp. 14UC]|nr:mRNA-capping enzyme subunit beta [Mortierella sp. 14UC]